MGLSIYILAVLGLSVRGIDGLTFKVLWMAPNTPYNGISAGSSADAFQLAMNDVTAATGDSFTIEYKDSDCSSKVALSELYEAILGTPSFNPDAIIGPPCSAAMAFVGQLAGYRIMPSIGWVSDSPEFADKTTYNTMIRVLPPINVMATGLLNVLMEYNWKRVFLLSSVGDPYEQLGTTVNDMLTEVVVGYTVTRWIDEEPAVVTVERATEIYKLVQKEARIVILAVPANQLRFWMLQAEANGMADGDYVFIYLNPDLVTDSVLASLQSDSLWNINDENNDNAKKAFQNVLILTPQSYDPAASFTTDATSTGNTLSITSTGVDNYAPYLYDAVRVYALLAREADGAAQVYTDGSILFTRAQNRIFSGPDYKTGPILLNADADRLPDFLLLDLADSGSFTPTVAIESTIPASSVVTTVREITPVIWGNGQIGKSNAPKDVPDCGFSNENCILKDLIPYIVPPVVIGILIIIALAAFFTNRKLQFERSLKDMGWMLKHEDLKSAKRKDHLSVLMAGSHASSIRRSRASGIGSHHTGMRSVSHASLGRKSGTVSMVSSAADDRSQIFVKIVKYKTSMVAVKRIHKPRIKIDRDLLVEMRTMTNIKNNNMAQLIGATTEPPEILEVWEYCSKGSLQDVIWNDNITFEDMFKFSVAIDIFKGLKYLHDSHIKVHGRLKSSNCVIDGRWVCKLTDYGLLRLREGASDDPEMTDYARHARLLWTAPELLRTAQKDGKMTDMSQEADIYAGAIILKEIFARNGPYTEQEDDMEPDEILDKVRIQAGPSMMPFRPSLTEVKGNVPDKMLDLIKHGWSEKPGDRPSAGHVVKDLQRINPNKSANVMDNMVRMMERYTNHLEEVVGERTVQVEDEKRKSEMLLYRMLPKPIAEDLKRGKSIEAMSYDSVSLYFSDIVKFTALSAQSTPMQVVDLLNGLYTIFDSAIANHDVYKVETIGDAYMLVSGLPNKNGDRHAVEIANCAMDLLSGILNFKVSHMPEDYVLRLRIGLHTGPAVAGVVGLTMPRYCLFGNTVTIAQTMESGGQPMRIQMSQYTYNILKNYAGYHLAARNDPIDIKGLGKTNTYWLINRKGYDKDMPDFDELAKEDAPRPTIFPVTTGKVFRPSVTESGIFELESEDPDPSRKTSAVDPELEQISEKSQENMRSDPQLTSPTMDGEVSEASCDLEADDMSLDTNEHPRRQANSLIPNDDVNVRDARVVLVRSEQDGDNTVMAEETLSGDIRSPRSPPPGGDTEDSWANPGKAAGLKMAKEPVHNRPTTASSIRTRLRIAKPNKIADITLEDTDILGSDDDDEM